MSIIAAKLLATTKIRPTIVATDYHPDVLENLKRNVRINFPTIADTSSLVEVKHLDWENPKYGAPLDERYDIILAADVIYHPDHARWIKNCVEQLLRFPRTSDPNGVPMDGGSTTGGVFWLMIPVRSTGRHEGLDLEVDRAFSDTVGGIGPKLVILRKEDVDKQVGLGRADEGGYKLFKIGWNAESG